MEPRPLHETREAVEHLLLDEGQVLARLIFPVGVPMSHEMDVAAPDYGILVLDREAAEGLLQRMMWVEYQQRDHGMEHAAWYTDRVFMVNIADLEELGDSLAPEAMSEADAVLAESFHNASFRKLPDIPGLNQAWLEQHAMGSPTVKVRCNTEALDLMWYDDDLDLDLVSPSLLREQLEELLNE